MVFNWELFINLANELLDGQRQIPNPREECLRTIISRFYYGVFCIAKNYKESQGRDFPGQDIHLHVRNAYIDSPVADENSIGRNLLTLWRKRVISDYHDDRDVNLSEARTAHQLTFNIFQKLKKIAAVPQD
jgi:hypothetical protein